MTLPIQYQRQNGSVIQLSCFLHLCFNYYGYSENEDMIPTTHLDGFIGWYVYKQIVQMIA